MNRLAIATILVILVGCASERRYVRIDTSFLREVNRNPSWRVVDEHYDEFLYLVSTGDREAIAASVRILCQGEDYTRMAIHFDDVLRATYEGDIELFWRELAKQPPSRQCYALVIYDRICPIDWRTELKSYLEEHRETRRCCEDELLETLNE